MADQGQNLVAHSGIETVDVAILGAGFSGVGMAIQLIRNNRRSFVVLEKAENVGGTWRENHYPGVACDIPSHLYSFSFARNPDWSRMYPPGPEIHQYIVDTADKEGVRPFCRFGFAIRSVIWDDQRLVWRVTAQDGRSIEARLVVSGTGGLHVPGFPTIKGMETFAGPAFHTSEWRHDVAIAGKRVAVIGTGASAIQVVPAIVDQAAHVDLFQRSAPWIIPRGDRAMSRLEKKLFKAVPLIQDFYRYVIFQINELRAIGYLNPGLIKRAERLVRGYLRSQVKDRALRAKLTPDYAMGCKRVLISSEYYRAMQHPHLSLHTDAIQAISPRGVVTQDGVEHACDVIVYATGFKPTGMFENVDIRGIGGVSLGERWAKHAHAYWGVCTADFPNLFFLMGPNTGLGHNSMIYMIESQIQFVLNALDRLDRSGHRALAVRAAAEKDFNTRLQTRMTHTVWNTGCQSWYQGADGINGLIWPGFCRPYRRHTRDLREIDFHWFGEDQGGNGPMHRATMAPKSEPATVPV